VEGKKLGVESICTALSKAGLQVAPSTYYAAKTRPASARAQRDAELRPALRALWEANYRVYGARKLWKAARRAGHDVGRDQVARLMRAEGIEGARRTKRVRTTRRDNTAARHPDLVKRNFTAARPNQLWVTDLTFVPTFAGIAYVCFIIDAFSRMIVGWRVAGHMRTEMVLDAIEMARWSRGTQLEGLRCHSDAGSQGGFNWSSQHLDHGGVWWRVRGNRGRSDRRARGGSGPPTGRCRRRCGRRAVRSRRGLCSVTFGV
jgi:putative transposase